MSKELSVCNVEDYLYYQDVVFHPDNAELRTITKGSFNKLKTSLKIQGFFDPIHIWLKNHYILAGNHRAKAAIELIDEGYSFITRHGDNWFPCILHDCDETTALGIMLQTNSSYAEWLDDGLHAAIRDFEKRGGEVDTLGFSEAEISVALDRALEDAEEILEKEVDLDDLDIDEDEIKKILKTNEGEYGSLVLPINLHKKLVIVLSDISKRLNSSWADGDNYDEAIEEIIKKWKEGKI